MFFYVTCRNKAGEKTTLQNHIIKLIPIVQLRPHVLHRQLIDWVINMFYYVLFELVYLRLRILVVKLMRKTQCREDKNWKSEDFLLFC